MTVSSAVAETISVIDEDNVNLDVEIDYSAVNYVLLDSYNSGNTFVVENLGSFSIDFTLYWSHDNITYNEVVLGETINFSEDKKLYLRGYSSSRSLYGIYIETTGNVDIYGNAMALLDWEHPNNNTLGYNAFHSLFSGALYMADGCCRIVDASNFYLPSTTLAEGCYKGMFYGVSTLTVAPSLPATSLATYCYDAMFWECSSLVSAPELPATTLALGCYANMFYGCCFSNGPLLPAPTLVQGCYAGMFYNCARLTTVTCLATDISATNCINEMFKDVYSTGTLIRPHGVDWPVIDEMYGNYNGIPVSWTAVDYTE